MANVIHLREITITSIPLHFVSNEHEEEKVKRTIQGCRANWSEQEIPILLFISQKSIFIYLHYHYFYAKLEFLKKKKGSIFLWTTSKLPFFLSNWPQIRLPLESSNWLEIRGQKPNFCQLNRSNGCSCSPTGNLWKATSFTELRTLEGTQNSIFSECFLN